jgi:chromosome segregation ATPase
MLHDKIGKQNTTISKYEETIINLNKEIYSLKSDHVAHEKETNCRHVKHSDILNRKVISHLEEIKSLKSVIEAKDDELEGNKIQIGNQDKEIFSLNEILKAAEKENGRMLVQMESKETTILEQIPKMTAMAEQIEALTVDVLKNEEK